MSYSNTSILMVGMGTSKTSFAEKFLVFLGLVAKGMCSCTIHSNINNLKAGMNTSKSFCLKKSLAEFLVLRGKGRC